MKAQQIRQTNEHCKTALNNEHQWAVSFVANRIGLPHAKKKKQTAENWYVCCQYKFL